MTTYTNAEVRDLIWDHSDNFDVGYDNQGQMILYTQIYKWSDGTFRDEADPSLNDNWEENP